LPTVVWVTLSRAATFLFDNPVRAPHNDLDRNGIACDFRRRDHRSNCALSPEVNSGNAFGRPVRGIPKSTYRTNC